MSDYSLRGMRIGSASSPLQRLTDIAARRTVSYTCPRGHGFTLALSAEAEAAILWDCRCGAVALLDGATAPTPKAPRPVRSHWDILRERRSIAELEVLLTERLAALHDGVDEMDDDAIDLVKPGLVSPQRSAQARSSRLTA